MATISAGFYDKAVRARGRHGDKFNWMNEAGREGDRDESRGSGKRRGRRLYGSALCDATSKVYKPFLLGGRIYIVTLQAWWACGFLFLCSVHTKERAAII